MAAAGDVNHDAWHPYPALGWYLRLMARLLSQPVAVIKVFFM